MGWARFITLIVIAIASAISMSVTITGMVLIFPILAVALILPIFVSAVYREALSNHSWVDIPTVVSNTETAVPVVSTSMLVNKVTFSVFTHTKHC